MATEADLIQKFKDLNIPVGADFEELIHEAFAGANLVAEVENNLATKADDSKVVHKTGDEEISGSKTFDVAPIDKATGNPYITKSDAPKVDLSNYATKDQLATKSDDSKVVHNSGNEEIAGQKTFDTAPIDKATGNPYSTKSDITTAISAATANMAEDSKVAHLSGTNNFTGSIQHNGNSVGAHIQASNNDEDSAINDSTNGNSDDIYYWFED